MANTIVITGASIQDDIVTVFGTVNGVETTASVWKSAAVGMTQQQRKQFAAQALLTASGQSNPPVPDQTFNATVIL